MKPLPTSRKNVVKNEICNLITMSTTIGSLGEEVTEPSIGIDIFCGRTSVGSNEVLSAMQQGLQPQMCLIINNDEYEEQDLVKFNDKLFSIYRTYEREDGLVELYCAKKVGD